MGKNCRFFTLALRFQNPLSYKITTLHEQQKFGTLIRVSLIECWFEAKFAIFDWSPGFSDMGIALAIDCGRLKPSWLASNVVWGVENSKSHIQDTIEGNK